MLSRFIYIILSLTFVGCSFSSKEGKEEQKHGKTTSLITVDVNTEFQEIENFGASDAWSCQFVGNWPMAKKDSIANWLFSKEFDAKGNPKGIGLSLWRFNLGAGSSFQGDNSGIKDTWRRAESFLLPNGNYDWTKQKGQVWFAQKAKELEVENLLVFLNSPPVNLTITGKAFAKNGKTNIAPKNYKQFAKYLATCIKGMENMGLKVDYISPFNEPQWDWSDGGQEGTPYLNSEINSITKVINNQFLADHISTKIDITEAGQINYLYQDDNRPKRGSQIDYFYNPNSDGYIGDLDLLNHSISAHSYFTTSPKKQLIDQRIKLNNTLKNNDVKYWMSEYCILGDNAGEIEGNGKDVGMNSALYMAKVIHHDLVDAQASAWHWWTAISAYDYKDGLIYIDKNESNGAYEDSKMLWVLGNYSRFIRPGYKRIKTIADESINTDDFLISAFTDSKKNKVILVIVALTDAELNFDLNANNKLVPKNMYTTSSNCNLKHVPIKNTTIHITEPSVTTIMYETKK
ncbi:xylanase [Neptunitalea sp. Y10]|uniref:Xylanase n=2 Tax=Neptunitalea lumnitzerae TaxID=2965509 RepID=A0ABQ5MJC7_9FLAO|nr:xylanase [Neptunitalea sp. Y10]